MGVVVVVPEDVLLLMLGDGMAVVLVVSTSGEVVTVPVDEVLVLDGVVCDDVDVDVVTISVVSGDELLLIVDGVMVLVASEDFDGDGVSMSVFVVSDDVVASEDASVNVISVLGEVVVVLEDEVLVLVDKEVACEDTVDVLSVSGEVLVESVDVMVMLVVVVCGGEVLPAVVDDTVEASEDVVSSEVLSVPGDVLLTVEVSGVGVFTNVVGVGVVVR